jgi:hypothetical protein
VGNGSRPVQPQDRLTSSKRLPLRGCEWNRLVS